jgi:histidine triad (HIT) family protein
VFHVHFHVVPRREGLDLRLHARHMADPKLLAEHAARIRAALD